MSGTPDLDWARHWVAALAASGLRHAVISPGARSTALTLALLRQPEIDCEIILDERCAAFFALGLARATRQPIALVATSGTAPAHWLPATMEAAHTALPLLLLSADRPPQLHACGANQTTDQSALFTPFVRARHLLPPPCATHGPHWLSRLAAQVMEECQWPHPGPVHVNLPFHEPQAPDAWTEAPLPTQVARWHTPRQQASSSELATLARQLAGTYGWIVCGELHAAPGFADALCQLAERLGWPILAEPLSQLRFGPHLDTPAGRWVCTQQENWGRQPAEYPAPTTILRFGTAPVTRSVQQAIATLPHILVDALPRRLDPQQQVTALWHCDETLWCRTLAEQLPERTLTPQAQALLTIEQTWQARATQHAGQAGLHEAAVIRHLLAALPATTPLFVGNSLPIRDFDAFSGRLSKPLGLHANRGLSGIDGNVSTVAGLAKAHGRAVGLIGDLSFQHDLGGLACLAKQHAVIIVINNGGGGIFDELPPATLPEYETGWLTPQTIDLCAAARSFGIPAHRCATMDSFASQLTEALHRPEATIIELVVDRLQSRQRRQQYRMTQ